MLHVDDVMYIHRCKMFISVAAERVCIIELRGAGRARVRKQIFGVHVRGEVGRTLPVGLGALVLGTPVWNADLFHGGFG